MLKIPKRITIRVTYSVRCLFEEIEQYQSQPNISRLVRRALRAYALQLKEKEKSDADTLPSGAIAASSAKGPCQTKKPVVARSSPLKAKPTKKGA